MHIVSKHSYLLPLTILLISILSSCGLKYVAPETPEDFLTKRHTTVENDVRKDLLSDSLNYTSIAFGETKIIKPSSFKILDSLYEVKYQNEQKEIYDKELDQIITEQRQITQRDTAKIQYLEYHVFSYKEGDSVRIVEMEVTMDRSLVITNHNVIATTLIPKKMVDEYKRYLFHESFLYPESLATEEEDRFYAFYRSEIDKTTGDAKDKLINHTLTLMDLAHKKKSVRTYDLLITQAKRTLETISTEIKIESISEIMSEETISNQESNTHYWFTIRISYPNNPLEIQEYYFRFDHLLRLETIQKL